MAGSKSGATAAGTRAAVVLAVLLRAGNPAGGDTVVGWGSCDRGPMVGSQPYLWILLGYPGQLVPPGCGTVSCPQPPPQQWFEGQALGPSPSLDHFWRELSYGAMDLEGSDVVGWYDLDHGRDYYFGPVDRTYELTVEALAKAAADVDLSQFSGFHLMLSGEAWAGGITNGGTIPLQIDGEDECVGVTWLPCCGWMTQAITAHEMGHSLGVEYHSSAPYPPFDYGSQWDLMSENGGTRAQQDPVYGALGQHTIAFHKDTLGWIHPAHRYEMPLAPTVASVRLHELTSVPPPGRHLMAKVAWPAAPSRFYTAELRRMTGYDLNLPGEGVIIHEVDLQRKNKARVADGSNNLDPNDDGAAWVLGESFVDEANRIVITVELADATSSVVTLTNAALHEVYVDGGHSGPENGTPASPWSSVWEGHGAVFPGGAVWIAPGSYDEAVILRKPAVLRRWGGAGSVVIGE